MIFYQKTTARECSTCSHWYLQHSNDINYGNLGECRRFPPSGSSSINIVTREDQEIYKEQHQTYQDAMIEEEKKWAEDRARRLRKADVRLKNIEGSISSGTEQSRAHWEQEAERQKQRVKEILDETFDEEFYSQHLMPPCIKPVKEKRGVWFLTCGSDCCGEWKE